MLGLETDDVFYFLFQLGPFNSSNQLKDYLGSLYDYLAQYDNPPSNLMSSLCDTIDGAPKGSDVLDRIAAAANDNLVLP